MRILTAISIVYRLSSVAVASNYGMSIGDLMGKDNTFADETVSIQTSYYEEPAAAHPNGVNTNNKKLGIVPSNSKPMSGLSQREFKSFYNNSGYGYDLRLPAWLCADILLGDWTAPSGEEITNGSLGDLAQQLRLPPNRLAEYTVYRADIFQRSISDKLNNILCKPTPNGGRVLTYDGWHSQDLEGFWVAYILAGVSTAVVGWTGLHVGVAHPGSAANITVDQQVYILTATAVAEYIAVTTIFRLQTNGYISYVQAFVLNAIWSIFEVAGEVLTAAWDNVCADFETFRDGVATLANQALNRLFVFNPRRLSRGGGSALDLVGQVQDVETGHGLPGIGEGCVAG
ncbi:uncharacterized protein KY384_006433 [Bacidia gigantensis]|uniref:uncharacterized protein n=1 Tax=Bacidia gigantensis TaxID=2732470 RepID=UPI001D0547BD|nr:uncharacterized protein KY384_006433 [Bacidia gigantensis]KAG8528746.1 hypothetical protein KY384_006433 [Bacidia gigantensis]